MALKNRNQSVALSAQSVLMVADKSEPEKMVEVPILYFNATVDSTNQGNMSINSAIANSELYREHRTECLADQTAFEDAVYAIVDSMTPKEGANEVV